MRISCTNTHYDDKSRNTGLMYVMSLDTASCISMGNIPRFISDDGSDEDESDEDDDDYSSSDSEDGAWDFEVHIG